MQEVEVKYQLTEAQYVSLQELLLVPSAILEQVDTYYAEVHKGMSLRIRQERVQGLTSGVYRDTAYMTLKLYRQNDGGIHSAEEVEPEIALSLVPVLEDMFELLGISKDTVVKKVRTEYNVEHDGKIALDNVQDLGYFMEIEVLTEDVSEGQALVSKLIKLYVGDADLPRPGGGYRHLLQNKLFPA